MFVTLLLLFLSPIVFFCFWLFFFTCINHFQPVSLIDLARTKQVSFWKNTAARLFYTCVIVLPPGISFLTATSQPSTRRRWSGAPWTPTGTTPSPTAACSPETWTTSAWSSPCGTKKLWPATSSWEGSGWGLEQVSHRGDKFNKISPQKTSFLLLEDQIMI